MNQWRSDFELLQAFARQAEQTAFTCVVQRHIDLVFGTAMRKTNDREAATEIAQNVFAVLARKAWQFASDDSLPAWLHKTALLESKQWLRGEMRRRQREEVAGELGTTMKTSDAQADCQALIPLLDEALLSLREKDRTALLLRFYESRSLREVGTVVGIKEDAAQKRVANALEQVAQFFRKRGFRTATGALAAAALEQTSTSASATVTVLVANSAAKAAPVLGGLMLGLARLVSLSKVQTAAVCLALSAVPVATQWNGLQKLKGEVAVMEFRLSTAQKDSAEFETEMEQMQAARSGLEQDLARAESEKALAAQAGLHMQKLNGRIRGMLTDPDYHWPDDLPFVRIPKSVLSKIDAGAPIASPGKILPHVRELLGLSPSERARLETAFSNYFSETHQMIGTGMFETNITQRHLFGIPASAAAAKAFVVPRLGDQVNQLTNQLFKETAAVLGPERKRMMDPDDFRLKELLRAGVSERAYTFAIHIDNSNTSPTWGYTQQSGGHTTSSSTGMSLALVLEERQEPEEPVPGAMITTRQQLIHNGCPEPVADRILVWLREQAELFVPKK